MSVYKYSATILNEELNSSNFQSLVYRASEMLKNMPKGTICKIYDNTLSKKCNCLWIVGTYTYDESSLLLPIYNSNILLTDEN